MAAPVLGASVTAKLTGGAIGTLVLASGGWALALLAQEPTVTVGTLIPAGALTATSGALVYVVRLIATGALVHRDAATESAQLAKALERSNALHERSLRREGILTDLLTNRQGRTPT